jgi:hypothetical protein
MSSVTSARWRADRALTVLVAGLMVRRLVEAVEVAACTRFTRRRKLGHDVAVSGETAPRIVCVVPLFQEGEIAVETVRFWEALTKKSTVGQVLFVTTIKEEPRDGPSTHDLVAAELAELGSPINVRLIRCEQEHRFRAVQLNAAIDAVRADTGAGRAQLNTWVGVYNADSRPAAETFDELVSQSASEPSVRVYQQLVDYLLPDRAGSGRGAAGNATLQTWWTRSHYYARNTAGRRENRMSATLPYSTFGHGEFFRLDFLDDIGGFPDFAYADGLLVGWICRLRNEPIGLLASLDYAEVPRFGHDLTTQQFAWMRGLLNFGQTVEWARRTGQLALSPAQLAALRAAHLSIPVIWGLSTPVLAGLAATVGLRMIIRGPQLGDVGRLAAILAYPVIPAVALPRGSTGQPGMLTRIAGCATTWPREGLAFWPALAMHLRGSQQAPAKTPR